jgi:phosphopantothenoylcysteine decarboxylase/phosphopantothenate--cysteine ligase
VLLAVCGGIAAFKAVECLRLLTEAGAEVRVAMTPEAHHFVGALTFEALSYNPVASNWLAPRGAGETHIALSEWAEVILVVPATANTIAKLALGIADEIVSGTVLASRAPLVMAPAMNDLMLSHPATEEHLQTLRKRGVAVIEPVTGRLASGKEAAGRLASPERIVSALEATLEKRRNLSGLRVVITAGGTREAVDPVRFVGNFSSGKMGRALAQVADARGASVTLITTAGDGLEGVEEVPVSSAQEMLEAVKKASQEADVLVMAAAVADYRPEEAKPGKIKRTNEAISLKLLPNVDVLATLGSRPGLFRVGFAAETEDLARQAEGKLRDKGLDLIVANQVGLDGQGLGSDFNAVTVLGPKGVVAEVPRLPKVEVAKKIWDAIESARRG